MVNHVRLHTFSAFSYSSGAVIGNWRGNISERALGGSWAALLCLMLPQYSRDIRAGGCWLTLLR